MSTYTFTLTLDVDDEDAVIQAAIERYIEDGTCQTEDEAREFLALGGDGDIDIGDCLVMLLDPGHLLGCSIHNSSCDRDTF